MIITIDGPAGSGKSTVARRVAEKLGFDYLDTGAFYRVATLKALRSCIDTGDKAALARLIGRTGIGFSKGRAFLDGSDVTEKIRDPELTSKVHLLANTTKVREKINAKLRASVRGRNIVTEGRDQGSVVFKKAEMKFYLDATPEVRARRRFRELREKGVKARLKDVLCAIIERDRKDCSRNCSPLVVPAGAAVIDTTPLGISEVVGRIIKCYRRRLSGKTI